MQVSLEGIRHGMKVVDAHNHEIGKVDWVRRSDDDPATPETEAADVAGAEDGTIRETFVDAIAEAFRGDDLPEELRERLLQHGFIRLDTAGLFAADRYILPEQIAGVSEDRVMLNVDKDDLIKRH